MEATCRPRFCWASGDLAKKPAIPHMGSMVTGDGHISNGPQVHFGPKVHVQTLHVAYRRWAMSDRLAQPSIALGPETLYGIIGAVAQGPRLARVLPAIVEL